MGIFTKKIGPVFLKEDSDAEAYVEKLKGLSEKTQGNLKQEIEKQIAYAQYGLIVEKLSKESSQETNRMEIVKHLNASG